MHTKHKYSMSNNIDLVTVTCARDFGIQQLQSYSIDLMITKPCNHYVVIEDSEISQESWQAMLSPYYTRHNLYIISGRSLLSSDYYSNDSVNRNGWHRSVVLKLLVAEHIQSEKYLIIDSKNFFVCQQSLDDWPLEDGNGMTVDCDCFRWHVVKEFCTNNLIDFPEKVYMAVTPFVVDTNIVKKIIKFDILPLFFDKKNWWCSEFFLYSIFTQYFGNQLIHTHTPNKTFWDTKTAITKEILEDVYKWPNMRTFGLHRDVFKLKTDWSEFIDFLVKIGFERSLVIESMELYERYTGENQKRLSWD